MLVFQSLFLVVQRLGQDGGKPHPYHDTARPSRRGMVGVGWRLSLATSLSLLGFFLVSCSAPQFGGGPSSAHVTPTPTQVTLAQIHWCGKPLLIFRDEGAPPLATATVTPTGTGTPTPTPTSTSTPPKTVTLTDWGQIEPNLGFVVYLPPTLPGHTCLVSASGTLHDPIEGGSFTIGYLLPDHSAISLAEAPFRSQSRDFQCSPADNTGSSQTATPTPSTGPASAPLQVCSGVQSSTSIIFEARGNTSSLQQFFDALQPHINWVPAS